MKNIEAIKKAKSVFGSQGMALKLADTFMVGVYRPVFMNCYSSFHVITEGDSYEYAFAHLTGLNHG